jgi:phage gp37-like protein
MPLWSLTSSFTTVSDMLYNVEDIEDQIIATLKASTFLNSINCLVDTHAGEVSPQTFLNVTLMEGLIAKVPFVLIQYQGRSGTPERDAPGSVYIHTLNFRMFVAAKSLRRTQETQRAYCYPMLRAVYGALHGRVPLMDPAIQTQRISQAWGFLQGSASAPNGITSVGFNPQSPLLAKGGTDERLLVNINGLCVYQTDYVIRIQSS